ncbi:TPA: STM2901 family protein [Serratia marcescens]
MDTVEELNGTYFYKGYTQLTPQQLWWLITVDALREHLGISVADAVLIALGQPWLPTRQSRGPLHQARQSPRDCRGKPLPKGIRLPTLVGETPQRLHISDVNNWGKFIGRNVPWLGYALSAWTIYAIGRDVKDRFNLIARPADRIQWTYF